NKGHSGGSRDQKQDNTAGAGTAYQDLHKRIYSNTFIADGQDQAVKHADTGPFCCSENTAYDTADDDDDQEKAGDRSESYPNRFFHSYPSGCRIIMLLCIDKGNYHGTKTHEDTGDISGHKQCRDGYAACYS